MVGAFSHKFSIVAKLLIRSKKLGGAKMGRISSITMPSMVGIVGRAPAVVEKVWCLQVFLFVCLSVCLSDSLSHFELTTFAIAGTLWRNVNSGNAMKERDFQTSAVVIAQRKVCSCAPIFNFFCWLPEFSLKSLSQLQYKKQHATCK